MKLSITCLVCCIFTTIGAFATIPGDPNSVVCPKCDYLLQETTFLSWNTFGAITWSDAKTDVPGLPEIPFIVKCPGCGEYFFPKDNNSKKDISEFILSAAPTTTECKLDFDDYIKAFSLIENKRIAYIAILHSYNDYIRKGEIEEAKKRKGTFVEYGTRFLKTFEVIDNNDVLFKAELYREMGMFDQCIATLKNKSFESFLEPIAKEVKKRAEAKDPHVFKLDKGYYISLGEELYDYVQQMPSFKGGEKALIEYLRSELKYPEEAIKKGVEGTVEVLFIVERNGKLSSVKVSDSPHESLSEEAIRVMKKSPDWNPGRQDERIVRVNHRVPIKFEISEDGKTTEARYGGPDIISSREEFGNDQLWDALIDLLSQIKP